MPNNTLTIALQGDVPLDQFAESVQHFQGLIAALSSEISHNAKIVWVVEDLQSGSAVATIRGEAEQAEAVEKVVRAYAVVGRSLQRNVPIPYSDRVAREARALTAVLKGPITSIRFSTAEEDAFVSTPALETPPALVSAYDAVEGHIHTLSSRTTLTFTLYDSLYDRAVTCYLNEEQEELMRGAWGRRAIVAGRVGRDPLTGRPVTIRQVSSVTVLDEVKPGAYLRARGILARDGGNTDAVEAIRQVRDA